MANRSTARSIDEYIAEFPPDTQKVLEAVRAVIRAAAPGATERISYAIPTFDLNGHHLVYFAAFKKHVGLYPVTADVVEAFEEELKPYKRGKGSVQFPLDRPMPMDLIRRIVEFKIKESITRHRKPAGVLIGFESEDDWFDYRLEKDPQFLQRIEAARQSLRRGQGVRLEDIEIDEEGPSIGPVPGQDL